MALEIVKSGQDVIDFVREYKKRHGEVPLSVIHRETLIVNGMLPRASAYMIFLEDGVRLQEKEWKKIIYKPARSRVLHDAGEDFMDFAQRYRHVVTAARVRGGKRLKEECLVIGRVITHQGRPYIKASFNNERQITRMELGFRHEEPAFEIVDGTEPVIFRTRRGFWKGESSHIL